VRGTAGSLPDGVAIRTANQADLLPALAVWWRCDHGIDAEVPTEAWRVRPLEHVLATGTIAVAEASGEVVGFGGTVRRGGVSMVTDLFVDPRWHGRGIGAVLLDEVLEGRWPRQTFSSAHPNALPLYIRAGMPPRWLSLYVRGDPSAMAGAEGVRAEPGAEPAELAGLETAWGGVERHVDHAFWAGGLRAVAVKVLRRSGEPLGFAYMNFEGHDVPSWWVSSMGVAPSVDPDDTLRALSAVLALAAELGIGSLGLPLPGPHPATVPLLRAGWRIEDRDIYVASHPSLLDPMRRLPDPTFA
jgi:GNAT superfamily N-acetyltransferase